MICRPFILFFALSFHFLDSILWYFCVSFTKLAPFEIWKSINQSVSLSHAFAPFHFSSLTSSFFLFLLYYTLQGREKKCFLINAFTLGCKWLIKPNDLLSHQSCHHLSSWKESKGIHEMSDIDEHSVLGLWDTFLLLLKSQWVNTSSST